jgi:ATP-binding protein involved in chromosome partitioning
MNDDHNPQPDCGSGGCSQHQQDGASKFKEQQISGSLAKIRHKLMVMSGKGGVGKSSVSAALALQLAESGYQVGLMDVDLHGPSLGGIMGGRGLLDISAEKKILPHRVGERLKLVSMQALMQDSDQAVIWRGPAKSGVIRQFVGDVEWGELDFLIIDAPPGTGDEPLSVAQTIPDASSVIVTTPQEVALSDVRKSINFCRVIQMNIVGLVENMGPFPCPCCGKTLALFRSGGGQATADQMGVPFLGTLPFDPSVVKACDAGHPLEFRSAAATFASAVSGVTEKIITTLNA